MHLNGKLEISFWKELRTEPSTAQHSRAQYGIAFPESKPPHCYRLRLGSQQLLSLGTAMAPEATLDAWYMDDAPEDQRLPHRKVPNEPASMEKLAELGVLHWKIDADNWKTDETLRKIRADRGYSYEDLITITPEKLPNYEEKIKTFFEEHLHTDEEIRFIVDGSGYFDVRDKEDRWIRIDCRKGDLIILPAGIYHRFTLDGGNYITALRLFVGEPVWTPYNRPADDMEARKSYITQFVAPAVAAQ